MTAFEIAFNHDGFGILGDLAVTAMTEADAAALLVEPLAQAGATAIEWCVGSTGARRDFRDETFRDYLAGDNARMFSEVFRTTRKQEEDAR